LRKMSFFAGLIVGIILASGSVAVSASEKIEVVFSKFNFIVNGKAIELESDPLVYKGATYLPVRVISNLLGYDVTYKADSRTIMLTNQSSSQTKEQIPIQGGTETMSNQISEDQVEFTVWNEMTAAIYNGQIYFSYDDFKKKYYEIYKDMKLFSDRSGTYFVYKETKTSISLSDPNDTIRVKDEAFLNIKYFPQVLEPAN